MCRLIGVVVVVVKRHGGFLILLCIQEGLLLLELPHTFLPPREINSGKIGGLRFAAQQHALCLLEGSCSRFIKSLMNLEPVCRSRPPPLKYLLSKYILAFYKMLFNVLLRVKKNPL